MEPRSSYRRKVSDMSYNKKAYITILGRSVWAMVNTYYAVMRESDHRPDEIYIYTERSFSEGAEKGSKALEVINDTYDNRAEIEIAVVNDVDFEAAGKQLMEKINGLGEQGYDVSLDITPGRKPLVVGALLPARDTKLEHVFYLEISDLDDADHPYMQIPMAKQKLWDFTEVLR